MGLSITSAYIKIFNTPSAFPSNLSLLHLHVNQKIMLKRKEQTTTTTKTLSLKVGRRGFKRRKNVF